MKWDGYFLLPEALLGASLRKWFALQLLKRHTLRGVCVEIALPHHFPGTGVELLSINANCAVQNHSFVLEIVVVGKNLSRDLDESSSPWACLESGSRFFICMFFRQTEYLLWQLKLVGAVCAERLGRKTVCACVVSCNIQKPGSLEGLQYLRWCPYSCFLIKPQALYMASLELQYSAFCERIWDF